MNPRKQLYYIAAVGAMAVLAMLYVFIGSPVVLWHNHQLKSALTGLTDEVITLEQAVPFSWDEVYSFGGDVSLDEVRVAIGADSYNLKEAAGADAVRYVFLDDGSVTATVCGAPADLGYALVDGDTDGLPAKISYGENVSFDVERADGVLTLRRAG